MTEWYGHDSVWAVLRLKGQSCLPEYVYNSSDAEGQYASALGFLWEERKSHGGSAVGLSWQTVWRDFDSKTNKVSTHVRVVARCWSSSDTRPLRACVVPHPLSLQPTSLYWLPDEGGIVHHHQSCSVNFVTGRWKLISLFKWCVCVAVVTV